MKELLLAFIVALVIGSFINGWQQQAPQAAVPGSAASTTKTSGEQAQQATSPQEPRRDFPDFNSFPSLNQDNFSNLVLASQKPVFVICYSPNSLSFERMMPIVAAFAQEHADSITVARLNIMENIALAQKYEIYTIPTFMIFRNGEPTAKLMGVVAKDKLEAMLALPNSQVR